MEDRLQTRVQWLLGNNCNYKCSYCHEMFWKNDKPFPDEDQIFKTCSDIISHYDNLERDVVFEFLGGEPTQAGNLYEIGRRLHNHPVNFVLRTNGSADLDWWQNSRRYVSNVIISLHKEFCDLDHIEQVIDILRDEQYGMPVNIQVLIPFLHTQDHFEWAVQTRRRFRRKFDLGDYQLLFSNFARGSDMYMPYRNEQWDEYYRSIGRTPPRHKTKDENPLVTRDPHQYKGYKCHAGIDTLTIDNEGRIWRGWCNEGGPIGSIYDEDIAWPTDPIICSKEFCKNRFDHQAKKELILQP